MVMSGSSEVSAAYGGISTPVLHNLSWLYRVNLRSGILLCDDRRTGRIIDLITQSKVIRETRNGGSEP